MSTRSFDLIVIGAGPGGYVAAIRAAQLGKEVACVDAQWVGGVCLNVGCIPSKALISAGSLFKRMHAMAANGLAFSDARIEMDKLQAWKSSIVNRLTNGVSTLFKGHGIESIRGRAKLQSSESVEVTSEDGSKETIGASSIVIATGSRPIQIPGFEYDEVNVLSSTGALDLAEIPKRMCVVGGGYIGLEIGMAFRHFGCEVTVVELTDSLLPGQEPELVKVVARSCKKQKIKVHTGAKALGWEERGGDLIVRVETKKGEIEVPCDKILVTVGRRPNVQGIGLEELGIPLDDAGFIATDAACRTNVPGVYAIGDVVGQPMLAHKASKEGTIAAEAICGRPSIRDWRCIPAVIFTDPEIASVGLTADQAKEQGYEPVVGKFPFAANGRALSLNAAEGFAMVVADRETDALLGVHLVGPDVTELIAEAALAIEMGATAEDLALTIHAHPTLPESLMEAAEMIHGQAIHSLSRPSGTKES